MSIVCNYKFHTARRNSRGQIAAIIDRDGSHSVQNSFFRVTVISQMERMFLACLPAALRGGAFFTKLSLFGRFELFANRQIDSRLFQFGDFKTVLLEQIDRLILARGEDC